MLNKQENAKCSALVKDLLTDLPKDTVNYKNSFTFKVFDKNHLKNRKLDIFRSSKTNHKIIKNNYIDCKKTFQTFIKIIMYVQYTLILILAVSTTHCN